jgi:pyrroline-5-carboxylate reductase
MDEEYDVGVIGIGNAGGALAKGLARKGCRVIGSRRNVVNVDGVATTTDNISLVESSSVVVIAVIQDALAAVCAEIKDYVGDKLVVSLVAGVSTDLLSELLGTTRVARVMTGLHFEDGIAHTSFCTADGCSASDRWLLRNLLEAGGKVVEVKESKEDAHTSAAGCGVGEVAYIAAKLYEAYLNLGFDDNDALDITVSNLKGAARLIEKRGSAKAVAEKVASGKGATRRAIDILDSHNLAGIIAESVLGAEKRSSELSALVRKDVGTRGAKRAMATAQ